MLPSPVREQSFQSLQTIAIMLQIHVHRKGGMTVFLVQDLQDAMQTTSSPSCTGQADGDNVPGPDSITAAQTQEVCKAGEKTRPLVPSCTPLQDEGKSCLMMTYGHRYVFSEQQAWNISLETPRHW